MRGSLKARERHMAFVGAQARRALARMTT